ncbi:aromatic/alkene monooxygenase hydroxylase subunit beta [Methylibium petroleiphilum]|uniref:aromatic/alkene monooxygenase hydroxylase subunit beta n=1 Tax=Methylibium petroleiphilum TaxID=105560 RepID=UPI003D2CCC2A
MQVDIKTTDIHPVRQTFAHVARRLGADKPASRYQEATLDMQPTTNWHYRPLWDAEHHVFDVRRSSIVMADWYTFKDPRHFYYGVYTMARAKQQEGVDKQFEFAEKRNLLGALDDATRDTLTRVLVPLRHYEWGGNMNNTYCCAYGYGTAVTQACSYAAMDRLGIAQQLSRIGLLLDGSQGSSLDAGKIAWLSDPAWQGVRRVMENLFVTKDWFELFVAQNLVFDGLLYPLVFRHYVDAASPRTGNALAMLTEFINDWYAESARWVDATVKTAAEESPANAARLAEWVGMWRDEVLRALGPLAALALGEQGAAALADVRAEFDARVARLRLAA